MQTTDKGIPYRKSNIQNKILRSQSQRAFFIKERIQLITIEKFKVFDCQ